MGDGERGDGGIPPVLNSGGGGGRERVGFTISFA